MGSEMCIRDRIWSLRNGPKADPNPWGAASLEWQTPDTPPVHGNWGDSLPTVYRWAYDYSVPGAHQDFIPQNTPETEEPTVDEEHFDPDTDDSMANV